MMDKLYEDFTNLLLPKISNGLIITKDYFFDLFNRYISYLIIVDSLILIICILFIIIPVIFAYKYRKEMAEITDGAGWIVLLTLLIIPFVFACNAGLNLIKDIYIPEVRIYEQYKLK